MIQKDNKYPLLFSPIKVGKITLPNRTVMAPVYNGLLNENGAVNQRYIDYFVERAKNDVGLIVLQPAYIVKSLRPAHLSIADDRYIPGLSELTEAVKAVGSRIVLQLSYLGTQDIGQVGRNVNEMSLAEIEEFIGLFVKGADRAQQAGFDGIELHGAHGYFINQFLSPLDNHRHDEYSQDKLKFLREVVNGIRRVCGPNLLLQLRISAEEMVPGGLTLEDTINTCLEMEKIGVDAIHMSAGRTESSENIVPPYYLPIGLNAQRAEALKKRLSIPVIVPGRIIEPDLAEEILAQGKADLISFGRPLIADPEFVRKARTGRTDEIRTCLSCNYCHSKRVKKFLPIRCAVNPLAGRESKYSIQQTATHKEVWVIGGGPAGMEAARVAALRGNRVTLWESSTRLGGKLHAAKVPPGKEVFQSFLDYQMNQMKLLGIKMNLSSTVDKKTIAELRPDIVIVATGSRPIKGQIEIVNEENLTTAEEMLLENNRAEVSKRVVILGGGLVGAELADYLSETPGKEIIILEMQKEIAVNIEPLTRKLLLKRLENKGVRFICEATVNRIEKRCVSFINRSGEKETLETDLTVLALGYCPEETLATEISELTRVYIIGDAKEGNGDLAHAVYSGFLAGMNC